MEDVQGSFPAFSAEAYKIWRTEGRTLKERKDYTRESINWIDQLLSEPASKCETDVWFIELILHQ